MPLPTCAHDGCDHPAAVFVVLERDTIHLAMVPDADATIGRQPACGAHVRELAGLILDGWLVRCGVQP